MKNIALRLTDSAGQIYRWTIGKDARRPATWQLTDPAGYVRTLESNWRDSVPRVKLIAENHGLQLLTALS